jgi:hypothetical protein
VWYPSPLELKQGTDGEREGEKGKNREALEDV